MFIQDRDENFIETEKKNMSPRQIAQEYMCSFLASGDTFIDPDDIQRLQKRLDDHKIAPLQKTGDGKNLWIWKEPEEGKNIALALTFQEVMVLIIQLHKLLMLIHMNRLQNLKVKSKKIFLHPFCMNLEKYYNSALISIENSMQGPGVINRLTDDLEYTNIYCTRKSNHDYVPHYLTSMGGTEIAKGFSMTTKSRPLVLSFMEEVIRNEQIVINSPRLIDQFNTFVWDGDKPQAARDKNDDLSYGTGNCNLDKR
jgi:hypothetical protein